MRKALPVVSAIGLLGAGAAIAWMSLSRPADTSITHEVADSFNLQTGSSPALSQAAGGAGETIRDAVVAAPPAPSSLVRPIVDASMAAGGRVKAPPQTRATVITPKAEAWARKHKLLTGLIAKPAAFLMSRSVLGSARTLRAFLGDAKKVDAYMDSALVRIAINSPRVAKAFVGDPSVVRAFLETPAMRDAGTVRALLASPMARKMLDCPAVQQALGDPAVMNRLMGDTAIVSWVAAHPQALAAVAQAVPSVGDAVSARIR